MLMEGYHYFRGQDFEIWRFPLNIFLFGFIMSLIACYNHLRQLRNEQKDLLKNNEMATTVKIYNSFWL